MNHTSFTIAADHPCLAGHFPGHPIVPGVVLLERMIEAVEAGGGHDVQGIRRCKFVRPLYPDETCAIEWGPEGDSVRFVCRNAGEVLARGLLQINNG